MTDTVTQSEPEAPDETVEVESPRIYLSVTCFVDDGATVALSEYGRENRGALVRIKGEDSTVDIHLGVGWKNESIIAAADRPIEVLQQARENASERIENAGA